MFFELLAESLARRRARKILASLVVWIGMTLVTGLLALSLDVGDKMNRELRSFGANIKLDPAAVSIPVRIGGHELIPVNAETHLEASKLEVLKSIFWANNILEVSPRLWTRLNEVPLLGIDLKKIPRHWKVEGALPKNPDECLVGADLKKLPEGMPLRASGVVNTGGAEDGAVVAWLETVQKISKLEGKISGADISALTTPENKLAEKYRVDPKTLTSAEYDRWFCTPYPESVAKQIQEAVPGSAARVVRRVSESQGRVLTRIKGLVFFLVFLGVMACSLSVMGVLTSAVLERRTEVALLQAIGAHKGNILHLFVTEAGILGLIGGGLAAWTGPALGAWFIGSVFGSQNETHAVLWILAPLLGLVTALMASLLPILHTLHEETAQVLHGN